MKKSSVVDVVVVDDGVELSTFIPTVVVADEVAFHAERLTLIDEMFPLL